MAKSKSQLEAEHADYHKLLGEANQAISLRDYESALRTAAEANQFVAAMMQVAQKEDDREFDSVETIELIYQYAPPLLDRQSLDSVDQLLKKTKRVERDTEADMGARLKHARELFDSACSIWDVLRLRGSVLQSDLARAAGVPPSHCFELLRRWDEMGVVGRSDAEPVQIWQRNAPSETRLAICPSCGAIARGAILSFLDATECPKCNSRVEFVLTDRAPKIKPE